MVECTSQYTERPKSGQKSGVSRAPEREASWGRSGGPQQYRHILGLYFLVGALIPGTCQDLTSHGTEDLADVIKDLELGTSS